MTRVITEKHIKERVKDWYKARGAYHVAIVQNGMGVHGVPDRLGAVPIKVTPEMVGKTVGILVGVEAKRPGRREEERRGMTKHQFDHMNDINAAGGIAICCDGDEDLAELDRRLTDLLTTSLH